MINLYTWAMKWGLPKLAIDDLRVQMGIDPSQNAADRMPLTSEAGVANHIRLRVAQQGGLLWRNNVGAMESADGRIVRYGLANESKAVNQKVKSSDFVGVIPIPITPDMVGFTIGQFIAIETKKPGWKFTGNPRELAQRKFLELVVSKGGRGYFTNGIDELVITE